MAKSLVMLVDDDEIARVTLRTFLEDTYDIVEAPSGEACLEALKDGCAPDVFLLDVNMGGMDGYELCSELRRLDAAKAKPVLFVSAREDPEDLLASFESGGNGFLLKPVQKDNLRSLISYQLEHRQELIVAQKNAEDAMKVAMEAMTSSSELGQMIQFVKDAEDETTLEGVGRRLCSVTESFGLKSCAVVYDDDDVFINCAPDSLEAQILKRAKSSNERIVGFGVRTIVRSDCISILIKDMPVDDASRYGRFKDNLVVLASICDGRLRSLSSQNNIAKQRKEDLAKVISVTEGLLKVFGEKLSEHDEMSRSMMGQMIIELEAKLFRLGLDEDQEEELMQLAYKVSEKLESMKGESKELEGELGKVLEALYEILEGAS